MARKIVFMESEIGWGGNAAAHPGCAPAHLPGIEHVPEERRTKLSIAFVIPGEPQAKARARSRIMRARDGRQVVAHYTPRRTAIYEAMVRALAYQAMAGARPTDRPVAVTIAAHRSIPASWQRSRRDKAVAGDVLPTSRPDLDNVAKAVLDGLTGVVYLDDSQVCDLTKRKRYSDRPRVEVWVRELDGEPA